MVELVVEIKNGKEYDMKQKAKKGIRKYLSLLFVAAILLTAQGIPAQANDTAGQQTKAGELPANPMHHCMKQEDGTDDTDWSYVYFGSYPQTEVAGDALTSAITGASYDLDGDAWVDGTKYRRIRKSDTNYHGYFGDRDYRYFKWERIKWRVLKNDGSTLFVIADRGLDCKDYNEEFAPVTWEDCTLRDWLNTSFYHTAFSGREQEAVVGRTMTNQNNPEYGTEGGNNTNDKVCLLSIEEAANPSYGLCEDSDMNSASRLLKASDYAHAMGAGTGVDEYGGSCWWLRSPGSTGDSAAAVLGSGYIHEAGSSVNIISSSVVPALHIDLSSDLWFLAEDESSGEGADAQGNAVIENDLAD